MPRTLTEIRSLARSHTRTAINALVGVMKAKDATHAARVSAATAILDRGWGRPPQALESGDNGALELIHRIERVIVSPENTNSKRARLRCPSSAFALYLVRHRSIQIWKICSRWRLRSQRRR